MQRHAAMTTVVFLIQRTSRVTARLSCKSFRAIFLHAHKLTRLPVNRKYLEGVRHGKYDKTGARSSPNNPFEFPLIWAPVGSAVNTLVIQTLDTVTLYANSEFFLFLAGIADFWILQAKFSNWRNCRVNWEFEVCFGSFLRTLMYEFVSHLIGTIVFADYST